MATMPPNHRCMVCGEPLEYEAILDNLPEGTPMRFGPTNWQPKAHTCPPGAVDAWTARVFTPKAEMG